MRLFGPTWLAYRSLATAIGVICAGWILRDVGLPAIAEAAGEEAKGGGGILAWLVQRSAWLPLAGLPAAVLGLAALVLRPMRTPLALLAMVASAVGVAFVVGTLIGSLAPLYKPPADLIPQ